MEKWLLLGLGGGIMSQNPPKQLKKGEYYADYDYGIGRFAVYYNQEEEDDKVIACFDDEEQAIEYANQLNNGTLILQ